MAVSSGNMYDWVGLTWNPEAGACPHDCSYCSTKHMVYTKASPKYQGAPRLWPKALAKDLKSGQVVFVCAQNDLFADLVPPFVISVILAKCREFQGNTYVFQTKNPARLGEFAFPKDQFPAMCIFGMTLESDIAYPTVSKAPAPCERAYHLGQLRVRRRQAGFQSDKFFVTVEPILLFNLDAFFDDIDYVRPDFVNIGADSKRCNLPEPSADQIRALVELLREKRYEVRVKPELRRRFGVV